MGAAAKMKYLEPQPSLPSLSELIQGIPSAPHLQPVRTTSSTLDDQVHRPPYGNADKMASPSLLPAFDNNNPGRNEPLNSSYQDESSATGHTTPTPPPTYSQPCDHDLGFDRLQNLISQPELDVNAFIHCISNLLDGPVEPAYGKGWYRPHASDNAFSSKLEEAIRGFSQDELVEAYFFRRESRQPYGALPSRVSFSCSRKVSDEKEASLKSQKPNQPDAGAFGRRERQQRASEQHAEIEQKRRCRHRYCQMQSDLRCSEIAFRCGEQHARIEHDKLAKTRENGTKFQSAKGTGKDEQLFAAVYAHELGGRIVQLEHDGRKRAERIIHMLCGLLLRSCRANSVGPENRHLSELPTLFSRNCSTVVGVKRSANGDNKNEQSCMEDTPRNMAELSIGNSSWKRQRSLSQDDMI